MKTAMLFCGGMPGILHQEGRTPLSFLTNKHKKQNKAISDRCEHFKSAECRPELLLYVLTDSSGNGAGMSEEA